MEFNLDKSIEILNRTPKVLDSLLYGISSDWGNENEGGETWGPYDVVGHLIYLERMDWMERAKTILYQTNKGKFEKIDWESQFDNSVGKSMGELLHDFQNLRRQNLILLQEMDLNNDKLDMTGRHSKFGAVTLRELISAWVVHDLNHLAQITRVMAKQYKDEVGPWKKLLKIVNQ